MNYIKCYVYWQWVFNQILPCLDVETSMSVMSPLIAPYLATLAQEPSNTLKYIMPAEGVSIIMFYVLCMCMLISQYEFSISCLKHFKINKGSNFHPKKWFKICLDQCKSFCVQRMSFDGFFPLRKFNDIWNIIYLSFIKFIFVHPSQCLSQLFLVIFAM